MLPKPLPALQIGLVVMRLVRLVTIRQPTMPLVLTFYPQEKVFTIIIVVRITPIVISTTGQVSFVTIILT